jgi:hypothetical protein
MGQYTDATKVSKVNAAFGAIAQEYVNDGQNKKALAMINALETLNPDSKIRLFDILTKVD